MMLLEYLKIVLISIKRRSLRSWLTILGVVIGITAIIALTSIGQGTEDAFRGVFESVGSDKIIITPGGAANPGTAQLSTAKLGESDLDAIKETRGIEHAFGAISQTELVTFKDESKPLTVSGVPTDDKSTVYLDKAGFFEIRDGRQFVDGEKYKVIIGSVIEENAFDNKVRIGNKIEILGYDFEVVGIQEKSGSPVQDGIVRIPLETFKELTGKTTYTSIFAEAKEDVNVNGVAAAVEKNLRKERDVDEGEEDFTVQTSEELIEGTFSILGQVNIFFVSIAAISLVVGGFGVMNTMFTAVTQRTKEIGIMKAVGARNIDIFAIFTIESGLIGLVGGLIGILLGTLMAKGVEYGATTAGIDLLSAQVSPELIATALIVSFVFGAIFGIVPAMKAARLSPVEAMRHG